jgi:hypothetical protein
MQVMVMVMLIIFSLHDRRHQIDTIFVINFFFFGSKSCPFSMDILGLHIPTQNLRDSPMFHVSPPFKNFPSGRCVNEANSVCSHYDGYVKQLVTVRPVWCYFYFYIIGKPNKLCKYTFWLFSYMSCLLYFVMCVRMLCSFCYWLSGCWLAF